MRLSDLIEDFIQQMMNDTDGIAEIQRNELASKIGCVPSQINYVITSRFTQEHGYIVESRRGGGGYIRITKVKLDRNQMLMHIVNSIGDSIDSESARIFISNLYENDFLNLEYASLISAALSDTVYRDVPIDIRDKLRASIFKQMLLTLVK